MSIHKLLLASATLLFLAPGPAISQTASLNAVLNGGNECDSTAPPAGPICRKGDGNGYGIASVTFPVAGTLCVSLLVDNLAGATAAHIHAGDATVNGGIVVVLPAPVAPGAGNPGAAAGCVPLAAATIASIRNNPGGFYVNVHNAGFPGGAIRGQLH